MNQYKHQFGTTRIPDFPADRIVTSWPATATHIIVLYRDQIFKVPVITNNGTRVPIKELEKSVLTFNSFWCSSMRIYSQVQS